MSILPSRSILALAIITGSGVLASWMFINVPLRARLLALQSRNEALRARVESLADVGGPNASESDNRALACVQRLIARSSPKLDAVGGRMGILAIADRSAVRIARLDAEEGHTRVIAGTLRLDHTAYRAEGAGTFVGILELLNRLGEQTPLCVIDRFALTSGGSHDGASLGVTFTMREGTLSLAPIASVQGIEESVE